MKYYLLTLGCQMNISDSQRIATKLESLGYKSAPEKEADLVVVNACSVRQHAVDRIWGKIKKWQDQNKRILITGCVLNTDKKKFSSKNIDIFNITELDNLNSALKQHSNVLLNNGISSREICGDYFDIQPKLDGKIAFIPIMTGCDNFCSYCAVPYTRGREVSRPIKDIIKEIKTALKNGYKEILLLGQNVNSYKINQKSKVKNQNDNVKCKIDNQYFIKLLQTIDNLPGDFRFNFISSNPHDMGDELIDCFANLKKWPCELHLPMQSGDDKILKKMNRKYNSDQYLVLISKIKNQISKIKISTDVIVGFPGETKKQFENTYNMCKKIGF